MSDLPPDVEGALRSWLRAGSGVAALVAQRVFFGVPKGAVEADFPLVTVARVGGGDDPTSEAPFDAATVQIDCWGSLSANGYGDKAGCRAVTDAVRARLREIRGRTTIATGVDAGDVTVESDIWLPDPADDRPRYSLTAAVNAARTT